MALTGEKMSEPEIDSLMQGQEDENGSVHYEGTCLDKPFQFNPSNLFWDTLHNSDGTESFLH